ncbi:MULTISPECIES: patatin-like phospholipase family protein [Maribacter]|jgi:predicted patatin/cPLA2 family phospholipase|uniref:Predicted acylesterase/phospholipase RssA, contains patatin domain n=1 Tax=Maribacter stanieri TaxID=440514 RepID=A0A1I6JWL1_9FLAO|nr:MULTISPECIES: patatin-like phospholipase family protein [Maribacter]SFR83311.1 Predicted acylesterase/phospholipase RssA, contains patatin domain [Maribacter stanieri]|tara:strand:+ start:936 stop:1850 length:915 start_codon:yes stop_codon:yes gene_type:complete
MKALVISGGGSKGAFAGGVAQYLIQEEGRKYDIFVGTSTGSLLISHLALGKLDKIKEIYSNVNQKSIFNNCPFLVKNIRGNEEISINHWNVLRNFLVGKKTFGESENLRKLIENSLTIEEFETLKNGDSDVIITVSNLSLNQVEYKSIKDCTYQDFCDWIWISANYTPFMSLVRKNGCEYADGGLGSIVPIEESIKRGATEVDVVVLHTEVNYLNRVASRNPFELITTMMSFILDRIEYQNIRIGKLVANQKNAIINLFYTPTILTTNSLIFDKAKMTLWWKRGYLYAKNKNEETNPIEPNENE